MKDWIGNKNFVFKSLGSSSHALEDRETYDFYATEPKAITELLKHEKFYSDIWECACGAGHMSEELKRAGYNVKSTDMINRGYGEGLKDFLSIDVLEWHGDIITNPPYKYSEEFVRKALQIIPEGKRVAMFMGIQFVEGKRRKYLFREAPPRFIYVSSSRLNCAKNGDFTKFADNSARCYAWYIWEKGYTGETVLKWFN